jgi:hypothetical protein
VPKPADDPPDEKHRKSRWSNKKKVVPISVNVEDKKPFVKKGSRESSKKQESLSSRNGTTKNDSSGNDGKAVQPNIKEKSTIPESKEKELKEEIPVIAKESKSAAKPSHRAAKGAKDTTKEGKDTTKQGTSMVPESKDKEVKEKIPVITKESKSVAKVGHRAVKRGKATTKEGPNTKVAAQSQKQAAFAQKDSQSNSGEGWMAAFSRFASDFKLDGRNQMNLDPVQEEEDFSTALAFPNDLNNCSGTFVDDSLDDSLGTSTSILETEIAFSMMADVAEAKTFSFP